MKTEKLERIMNARKRPFLERAVKTNNPAKILVVVFLIVIAIGSFLLWLPVSNQVHHASYLDNLFVAASAVCVTGLSTVTASFQYSYFGKTVLIFLMEIGGIGPMTIIAIFISRNRKRRLGMDEKKLFASSAGKSDLYEVMRYISRILIYTAIFETAGFILLSFRFVELFGWKKGLFTALFLSVSAFTNAGFDCLGAQSLAGYVGDPVVNLTVITLIIFGGLGFMVWFELTELFITKFKPEKSGILIRKRRRLSVHSSVVLKMTAFLLISGTVLIFGFELYNPGTLGPLNDTEKFLASLFQSVTLRTAGFATVDFGKLYRPTMLIMCLYMLIGGSPGGTAGGMKTTTIAVLYSSAKNTLDEKAPDAVINRRRVSPALLKQAYVILTLYVAITFGALVCLVIAEPEIETLPLLFEAVSAIATVGVSTGITASLSIPGKLIIIYLMFIGRVGPLSVYAAFHKEKKTTNHITYPDANIIIG